MAPLARYSAIFSGLVLLTANSTSLKAAEEYCAGVPSLKVTPALQPSLSVVKQPKAAFVKNSDTKGCPSTSAECTGKRFVVEGDLVVVVGEARDYACAVFTSAGPKTITSFGFIPKAALGPGPAATATKPADWVGSWSAGPEQSLAIKPAAKGEISIEGSATWGASDPEREKRGGVNTGEIAAKLPANGASLAFTMGEDDDTLPFDPADENYSCGVKMWRLGPYLIASDNGNCGGNNVTFAGVYRR